ncbi:putative membrane protein [Mesorhizobium shonense]|uniref:Membrane protein n=2 Tax=Phyllobacteriaceae TaxID=69277 RepID=A0ABV2HW43_9HYPH
MLATVLGAEKLDCCDWNKARRTVVRLHRAKELNMNARTLFAPLAFAMASFAFPAVAADAAQTFVDKAAIGGMFEVESSKLAQDRAKDQQVKNFAERMIADHGAANEKLKKIATEQKLQVPAQPDAAHKSDLEKLQNTTKGFDQPYVDIQRSAHADAVNLFQSYANDGDNPSLKAFAAQTLPTLKMHQDMIEKIAAANAGMPAVKSASTPKPPAPVPGANSFTEAQAKNRIQDAGYIDISPLAKDDKGVWRGQAKKDGKPISVALDYQGNVFAGQQ